MVRVWRITIWLLSGTQDRRPLRRCRTVQHDTFSPPLASDPFGQAIAVRSDQLAGLRLEDFPRALIILGGKGVAGVENVQLFDAFQLPAIDFDIKRMPPRKDR